MFLKEYFQIFLTLISIQEILTFSALDEDYIKDFIKSRKLREAGFNDFNLTSMLDTSIHDGLSISIDAASIHRRQRSAKKLDHYDVVINGFGESYRMTLKHTTSVLHPSATILTIDDDGETQWQGEHPNCFLIGDVHSHNGSVSASFCNELAGIMATDEHELYFEVLPHHIRRRSTIKVLKHTALLARKKQDRSKLASLKLENDYVNIDKGDTNVHKRRKRSVPSTSFTIEMAVYCDADFMTNHLHPTSTSDRVAAMIVKYNAVALEWGRSDVLGYTVTLSLKLLTFYDTNPSWYNTSTNLGVPLNSICTGTKNGLAYDHVHLHTGVKNPSLGGVAFQSRVCSVSFRCGVSSDGVTTYVTTAHEIGHNMGMLHDSDRGCTSPNVGVMGGAGVGWSTCSINDMDTMLQTGNHNCLWEENISDSEIDPVELKTVTLEPDLPGQYLTNDEICEKMYGSGFHYREYPHLIQTICNIYSCVDLNTNQNSVKTYGRMYKQSQSIAGSYCADNKICFDGSCQPWSAAQITNPEVRAGAWSGWGSWTTCSRTCGRGMSFRKRKCDNPTPKNHAPCEGNEHDAEGCNVTSCAGDSPKDSELIKQRATETCAYLINNNIISGTFYTTEGQIYSSFKHGVCEVECTAVDGYTIPSFTRFGLIEHGTPCPGTLDNPDSHNYPRRPGFYWACLEGYCQKFDCANTLNSRVYDGCGVCNGNNDTCVIRTGTMSDAITIWTRTEMTTIPVGAYNIEMSFVWNNNKKYYIEIYTKEGTKIIASSSSAGDPARIFETGDNPVSYGGTLWHFEYLTQIMYAKGPLDTPVVVKIYNYGSSVANTGVHYFYSVPLNTTTSGTTTTTYKPESTRTYTTIQSQTPEPTGMNTTIQSQTPGSTHTDTTIQSQTPGSSKEEDHVLSKDSLETNAVATSKSNFIIALSCFLCLCIT